MNVFGKQGKPEYLEEIHSAICEQSEATAYPPKHITQEWLKREIYCSNCVSLSNIKINSYENNCMCVCVWSSTGPFLSIHYSVFLSMQVCTYELCEPGCGKLTWKNKLSKGGGHKDGLHHQCHHHNSEKLQKKLQKITLESLQEHEYREVPTLIHSNSERNMLRCY